MLKESVAPDHPSAESAHKYLINRGLNLETWPSALRFHRQLAYYEGRNLIGFYPAIVGIIVNPDNKIVSLHRTYLTAYGLKAPVPNHKKFMSSIYKGALSGAAIRLYSAEDRIAITEGIENALSVYQETGIPTWATLSAHGMESVVLPERIAEVSLWIDKDKSGRGKQAAIKAAKRFASEGRRVKLVEPPFPIPVGAKGIDWNDVLRMGA